MLIELDKFISPTPNGLCLIECASTLSPTFLFMHFINNFTKIGGQTIFISLHTSAELFRIAMNKMAQRLDQSKFTLIAVKNYFNNSLQIDVANLLRQLYEEIRTKSSTGQPNLLIFDDPFYFLIDDFQPSKFLQFVQKLHADLPANSLFLLCTSDASALQAHISIVNTRLCLSPIGTGFGKNITGKMEIIQRDPQLDSQPKCNTLHYFCGQRSAKAFVPGSTQLLM